MLNAKLISHPVSEDTMAQKMICIEDFEKYASTHLTPSVRDYYNSGAGEQFSLQLNKDAFKRYLKNNSLSLKVNLNAEQLTYITIKIV